MYKLRDICCSSPSCLRDTLTETSEFAIRKLEAGCVRVHPSLLPIPPLPGNLSELVIEGLSQVCALELKRGEAVVDP